MKKLLIFLILILSGCSSSNIEFEDFSSSILCNDENCDIENVSQTTEMLINDQLDKTCINYINRNLDQGIIVYKDDSKSYSIDSTNSIETEGLTKIYLSEDDSDNNVVYNVYSNVLQNYGFYLDDEMIECSNNAINVGIYE